MELFLTSLLWLTSLCPITFGLTVPGVCPERRSSEYSLQTLPQCQVLLTVPHHTSPTSEFFRNISRNLGPCYQIGFKRMSIQLFHTNYNITQGTSQYVHVEITKSSSIFEGESRVQIGNNNQLNPCFKQGLESITVWYHENVFILWSCRNINLKFRDEALIIAMNRTKDERVDLNRVKQIVRTFTGDYLADQIDWPNESAFDQACERDEDFLKCSPLKHNILPTKIFPVYMIVTIILIGIIVVLSILIKLYKKLHQINRIDYLK